MNKEILKEDMMNADNQTLVKLVKQAHKEFNQNESEWYPPAYLQEARRLYVKWRLGDIPKMLKPYQMPLINEYLRK